MTGMKRTQFKNRLLFAAFLSVLIISALLGAQFVNVARANPWLFVTFGPPIPGTTPPFISIYSPQNNTVCASNVYLSLHISKPLLPAPLNSAYNGLTNIWYALDGNVSGLYFCSEYSGHGALGYAPAGIPEFNYSTDLILPEGKHSIEIFAAGIAFADSGAFFVNSTSTVFFTAGPNLTPTPSSTSTAVPSQSPPPTSSPTTSPTPSLPPAPTQSGVSAISMPVEYVNYTVSMINGSMWATVDGTYPMHIPPEWVGQQIPLVYPTPPGTTADIKVDLDGQPISWSNFTQAQSDALHYTYSGEWPMIQCTIQPSSTDFLLKIHYQHPIFQVNGSYAFLYDLNISPYLSASSNGSMAYFSVRFETNSSNIHVYAVPGDSSVPQDSTKTPVDFTASQDNGIQTVAFNITSSYSKPVPGDELILFDNSTVQVPELPSWIILPTVLIIITLVIAAIKKKRSGNQPIFDDAT